MTDTEPDADPGPSARAVAARRHAVAIATACVDRSRAEELLRTVLVDDVDYRTVALALGGMVADLVEVIATAKQEDPITTMTGIALAVEARNQE